MKCISFGEFKGAWRVCREQFRDVMVVCFGVGKFDIKVSAPALGIELLVSEHETTTLKDTKVGGVRGVCAWMFGVECCCCGCWLDAVVVMLVLLFWFWTGWQEHSNGGRADTGGWRECMAGWDGVLVGAMLFWGAMCSEDRVVCACVSGRGGDFGERGVAVFVCAGHQRVAGRAVANRELHQAMGVHACMHAAAVRVVVAWAVFVRMRLVIVVFCWVQVAAPFRAGVAGPADYRYASHGASADGASVAVAWRRA